MQMVGIDLNELPDEFLDYDDGHAYCTPDQPEKVTVSIEGVGESQEFRDSTVPDVAGVNFCVSAATITGASDVAATETTMPAPAVISPGITLLSNGVKTHYKAYALRVGFLMKANTSRRSGYTNMLEKQTFCCNKSGKPKINQEDVCAPVFEKLSSDSEESGDGQDVGRKKASCSSYKSPCGLVKKTRREFIIPTNCQEKMTVKLQKNNKWVVIGVVLEHNHRLIDKPSLTKTYMVSVDVDQQEYGCECCRFYRDGLLCAHILKVFTHIDVDEILEQYILTRWTQAAILTDLPTNTQLPDAMPHESLQQIRLVSLNAMFGKISKLGSMYDAGASLCRSYGRALETELNQLYKTRKKKKKPTA
ncbi:hypothetical protein D1007_48207 [Hordeum vulgare]|nr:hypothetical protein D1007_48207 [Hordeum vulgare]